MNIYDVESMYDMSEFDDNVDNGGISMYGGEGDGDKDKPLYKKGGFWGIITIVVLVLAVKYPYLQQEFLTDLILKIILIPKVKNKNQIQIIQSILYQPIHLKRTNQNLTKANKEIIY